MQNNTVLEIGKIKVVETTFEGAPEYNSIAFEWVERSSYFMHSGNDISIDIEKKDAIKLIEVLKAHFRL